MVCLGNIRINTLHEGDDDDDDDDDNNNNNNLNDVPPGWFICSLCHSIINIISQPLN
jgi:hypothetical protein